MCSIATRVNLAVCGAASFAGTVSTCFDQVRAQERAFGYFHLLHRHFDWALPFETRGLAPSALRHLGPERPARIATAPAGTSAGDMAVDASREALAQADPGGSVGVAGDVRWLLYCHTTVDERTGDSTACRLSHALQLRQCMPIAISQSQVAGTFMALLLAESLLVDAAPNDRVMIVAADKWLFPYVRSHGRWGVASDGAAALVLGGPGATSKVRVTSVGVASAPESMWSPVDALTLPPRDSLHAEALAERTLQASDAEPESVQRLTARAGRVEEGVAPSLCTLVERIQCLETLGPAPGAALIMLEGVHGDAGACMLSVSV